MELSLATLEDAHAIAMIHIAAWQAAYEGIVPAEYLAVQSIAKREAYWREVIPLARPEIVVARIKGEVVGWVAFGQNRDESSTSSSGEIWAIYVAPSHWSQGVGKALWLRARAALAGRGFESVSLWVLAENVRAIRFYLSVGFLPELSSVKDVAMAGKSLQEVRYITTTAGSKP